MPEGFTGKVLEDIKTQKETGWMNPRYLPFDVTDGVCQLVVSDEDIADAAQRLERFAPFIMACFPKTKETHGLIESPLVPIPKMQQKLEEAHACTIPGRLLLKMDSHLAIAGSVKARGGIYEVLKYAEDLALQHGKLTKESDYTLFCQPQMKAFFSQYTIQVGSTGNLGLSIGIISAALGFQVKVHMSMDAKEWKKDLLRSKGVTVLEYENDYSQAVREGRRLSDLDSMSYFVDDEKSVNLFLGYAVAAGRLQKQLEKMAISVDKEHPLVVYIPAGVGGAPGGIAYGLKRLFGDNVHCFFVEPTLCPSVLLGIATQQFEKANVHDYGISGTTQADGLACASPSGFVTRLMTNLLSGVFTVEDYRLYDYLRLLHESENIQIEPSSCAAFVAPVSFSSAPAAKEYREKHGLTPPTLKAATQIVWATGGLLLPPAIYKEYLDTYLT